MCDGTPQNIQYIIFNYLTKYNRYKKLRIEMTEEFVLVKKLNKF